MSSTLFNGLLIFHILLDLKNLKLVTDSSPRSKSPHIDEFIIEGSTSSSGS